MHALIFLWQPTDSPLNNLPLFDYAVAADSGLESAERWGVTCDLAIGDFDSASTFAIARAKEMGVQLIQVPMDKDESDRDLAVATALDRGATSITFIASSKGRVDYGLVVIQGLAEERLSNVTVDAWIDDTYVQVLRRGYVSLKRSNGSRVSLVPAYKCASGVSTSALRWPLKDATLFAGSGFSISNEMLEETAEVSVGEGPLLVMQSPFS